MSGSILLWMQIELIQLLAMVSLAQPSNQKLCFDIDLALTLLGIGRPHLSSNDSPRRETTH